jgi:serine/threonine protein kinase
LQFQAAVRDKYRIYKEIGRGGMAVVYEAEDLSLERRVALKFLLPDYAQDNEVLERFRREAIVASKLEHTAIVPIYNIEKADRFWYIVMKLVDGQNLKQILHEKGRLSVEEVIAILRPLASALDYAHENGVIHRDIKSSNFLITKGGRAYLTDFGIAKAVDAMQVTRTGSIVGTPEYMSPEQAEGQVCDDRADIYSFGIVAYEMLMGYPPFKGETPFATALKHIHEEIQFPGGTTPELIAIFRKCLAKSPNKRYQSASALIHDLERGALATSPAEREQSKSAGETRSPGNTPRRLVMETRQPPAMDTGQRAMPERRQGRTIALPLVTGAILVVLLLLILPDSSRRDQTDLSGVTGAPTSTPSVGSQRAQISSDTSSPLSLGMKSESATTKRPPTPHGVAQAKDQLVLSISSRLNQGAELRAYIIPRVDPQYGSVGRVKGEFGNDVLSIGGRLANGRDFEMTSAEYVLQKAVVRDLRLPAEVKFTGIGEYVIVLLASGSGSDTKAILGFRPFDVAPDGSVANFDGLEFSGSRKIVSFEIEE